MSLYTKLTDTTLRKIVQQFDIGLLQSWKILHGGVENTNHLICTESQKYVLTLCERKTAEDTTTLANILEHLAANKYPTSQLVKNRKNATISFYQNKPVLLKTYIEGDVKEAFDNALILKLGNKIAKLHQISAPKKIPHQFSYGQQHFSELYASVKHPFADWLKEMHQYILDNLPPSLPKAFIHGDIFTSNIVITAAQEPVIMDFEESCYYYRLFDLGMAAIGTSSENGQLNIAKINALLKGYQQYNLLTAIEKRCFKIFLSYAATATAFWRFRQFNILVPIAARKDSYKEMQQLAIQARHMEFFL